MENVTVFLFADPNRQRFFDVDVFLRIAGRNRLDGVPVVGKLPAEPFFAWGVFRVVFVQPLTRED